MITYALMPFDVVPSGDVVVARLRTQAAPAPLAGSRGQVRLAPAPRTDVFIPASGSSPGGHPA
jgi:hypothetical protein